MRPAGIAALNCVELTNVVATAVPPKLTDEEETKFVPLTVRVNAGLPATVLVGDMVVIVGTGSPPLELAPVRVEAAPPPHPARNPMLTIAEITSPLISSTLALVESAINVWQMTFLWDVSDHAGGWKT